MVNKGRNKFLIGEQHPSSKITEKQAKIIKELLEQNTSPTVISRKMKVSRRIIYHIKYGETWKHI